MIVDPIWLHPQVHIAVIHSHCDWKCYFPPWIPSHTWNETTKYYIPVTMSWPSTTSSSCSLICRSLRGEGHTECRDSSNFIIKLVLGLQKCYVTYCVACMNTNLLMHIKRTQVKNYWKSNPFSLTQLWSLHQIILFCDIRRHNIQVIFRRSVNTECLCS